MFHVLPCISLILLKPAHFQQRKLQRLYTLAVRASAAQRARSESRRHKLSFLHSPHLETMHILPPAFTYMYGAVSSLPPHDHAPTITPPELGKRPWETSKTGYLIWAKEQLVARVTEKEEGMREEGSSAVGALVSGAHDMATADDMKAALAAVKQRQRQGRDEDTMDVR